VPIIDAFYAGDDVAKAALGNIGIDASAGHERAGGALEPCTDIPASIPDNLQLQPGDGDGGTGEQKRVPPSFIPARG
jgi:hypothetical protein